MQIARPIATTGWHYSVLLAHQASLIVGEGLLAAVCWWKLLPIVVWLGQSLGHHLGLLKFSELHHSFVLFDARNAFI